MKINVKRHQYFQHQFFYLFGNFVTESFFTFLMNTFDGFYLLVQLEL